MAVAFDAVGPSSAGTTGSSPLSWTHTAGAGSNMAVIVGVSQMDGALSLGSVTATYGGTAMTFLGARASNDSTAGAAWMFGLVSPPTGAQTVVVTGSGDQFIGGSISFTGVDQTTPFATAVTGAGDDTGGTNKPTATVSSAANNMVVDILVYGQGINGATGTQRWLDNVNTNSAAGNAVQSTYAGASSVTTTYNVAGLDWWGLVAVSINAAVVIIPNQSIAAPWFGM